MLMMKKIERARAYHIPLDLWKCPRCQKAERPSDGELVCDDDEPLEVEPDGRDWFAGDALVSCWAGCGGGWTFADLYRELAKVHGEAGMVKCSCCKGSGWVKEVK